jgi:multisubunit Na+/H+ antiporter MnhB subunit
MDRNLVGGVVTAAGVVLLVLSALADPIGVGENAGFGWLQTLGVVVGAVVAIAGLALLLLERGEPRTLQPHH